MYSNKAAPRAASAARIVFLAAAMALAGCDTMNAWSQKLGLTADDSKPVGIGTKTDEFRRSPCACLEIEQAPGDAGYRERLRRALNAGGV